jgi:hypothetical protein
MISSSPYQVVDGLASLTARFAATGLPAAFTCAAAAPLSPATLPASASTGVWLSTRAAAATIARLLFLFLRHHDRLLSFPRLIV